MCRATLDVLRGSPEFSLSGSSVFIRIYTIPGSTSASVDVSKQDAGQLRYQFIQETHAQVGQSG